MLNENISDKRQKKVYYRLLRRILPLTLISLLLSVLVIYLLLRPVMEKREAELQNEIGMRVAIVLEHYLDDTLVALQTLSRMPAIANMEMESLPQYLEGLLKLDLKLQDVSLLDPKGKGLISKTHAAPFKLEIENPEKESFFVEAMKGKSYIGQLHFNEAYEPLNWVSTPVFREGKVVGILAARVYLSPLVEKLNTIQLGESGAVYIVSQQGTLVAHSRSAILAPGSSLVQRPIVRNLMEGRETRAFERPGLYTNEKGKKVVASGILIHNTGSGFLSSYSSHGIIVEREVSEALAPLWLLMKLTLSLTGGLILLLSLGMIVESRRVLSPLQSLRKGAEALASGNMGYRTRVETGDELQLLGEAFNHMAEGLQETIEKLSTSERQFRILVENMNEGLVMWDKNRKFLYVNPAYCRMLGYSREEIMKFEPGTFTVVAPDSREKVKEHMALREKGISSSFEYDCITKDGRTVTLFASGTPIIDKNGAFQGAFAVFTDLSEIRKTIEKLSASETQFRTLVETMSEGLIMVDKNGRNIYVNPAYCKLLGYTVEELIENQAGVRSVDPESREKIIEHLKLRKQGISSSFEYEGLTKEGRKIPLVVSGAPLMDKDGSYLGSVAIFTDLSEIKKQWNG